MRIAGITTSFCLTLVTLLSCTCANAETVMETKKWAANAEEFAEMGKQVAAEHELNLLALPGTYVSDISGVSGTAEMLIDGQVGALAANGRVMIDGKPARILYYLGRPRKIREIRIYTGNKDTRTNQDFEIRLANGSEKPGKPPVFSKEPTFTSGDTILGANGGGFLAAFKNADGGNLTEETFDWVEIKIWGTHRLKAGAPAKTGDAAGASAYVEIQVLADINDPNLFESEEEKQQWLALQQQKRLNQRLKAISADLANAVTSQDSLQLAIEDLEETYGDEYPGEKFLATLAEYKTKFAELLSGDLSEPAAMEEIVAVATEYGKFRREALMSNPLMNFERLLIRRAKNAGLVNNWISSCARGKGNYGNAIMQMSPTSPDNEMTTLIEAPHESFIGDMNLHWDGDRMLVTALSDKKTWQIFEADLEDGSLRQVTKSTGEDYDNAEATYLPDGAVVYASTACMMGIPCIGGGGRVANLYRLEADGESVRQITFEQDQDWCPTVLHNGRLMYLRWEYTDASHYFTRILWNGSEGILW